MITIPWTAVAIIAIIMAGVAGGIWADAQRTPETAEAICARYIWTSNFCKGLMEAKKCGTKP